jgi:hypothetical protein
MGAPVQLFQDAALRVQPDGDAGDDLLSLLIRARDEEGGVFRSEDGGDHWKLLEGTKKLSVRSLAIAPSDSNLLIAGSANDDPNLNGAFPKVRASANHPVICVAHLASAWKLPINPHTSMTGLNMAATIHFLAAIDNGGYFEGDVSKHNLFRDQLVSQPYEVGSDGCVRPLEGAGLGLQVDEKFLLAHPVIEGPAYV